MAQDLKVLTETLDPLRNADSILPDFRQEAGGIIVHGSEGMGLDPQVDTAPELHELDLGIEAVRHAVQQEGYVYVGIRTSGSPDGGSEQECLPDAISFGTRHFEEGSRDFQSLLLIHTLSPSIFSIMSAVNSLVHRRANSCL